VSCSSPKILTEKSKNITISKKEFLNSIEMVKISKGELVVGPRVYIDEGDKKSFTVKSFKLSRFELTQLQWVFIMNSNPSKFKSNKDCSNHSLLKGIELCPSYPVESVTKVEIDTFFQKLNRYTKKNYRLPSEIEWEHAVSSDKVHNLKLSEDDAKPFTSIGNETKKTIAVDSKKSGESGLVLTAGNVWEVTSTEYNKFKYSNIDKTSDTNHFVIKGGGWNSFYDHARRAYRGKWPSELKSPDVGLRIAL
jgi:formylglycine-generating enzyme required for sulfatase activity